MYKGDQMEMNAKELGISFLKETAALYDLREKFVIFYTKIKSI